MDRRGAAMTLLALAAATPSQARPLPALLPLPASIRQAPGRLIIGPGAGVDTDPGDHAAGVAATLLIDRVARDRGLTLVSGGDRRIRFRRDPAITGDEAYRLTVDTHGVSIAASGDRGLLYGAMTLAQLLSPDDRLGRPVPLASTTIDDHPRFAWRGLMVDVARHFQPLAELRRIIDRMVEVKLNTLHLHLTDDQGWRIEIKRYPLLTQVGAFRDGPSAGEPPQHHIGGFYTQDELRALVAYAAERGITVVPEIDFPGHVQSVVAAYPELGVLGDRPPVSNEWGISTYLLNPGPAGVRFLTDVLDEVTDIFPGQYVHVGGDEAVMDQWQRSPAVQAQMRGLGLSSENALQSWMTDQVGRHLAARGRRLIGWDELLEGGVPPSASIMSWRGEKGAIEAAKAGHDVVLTPAPTLYFDALQSADNDEPPGRVSGQDAPGKPPATIAGRLANVYGYDPIPAAIPPEQRGHVLGAQANVWSEYLVTPFQVEHMLFPRAAAIAEMTWTPQDQRDFGTFTARLDPQMARWRRSGVEVADSAFAVGFTLRGTREEALGRGRATVAMATQTGYGTIRYTTDGSAPTVRSRRYTAPVDVALGTALQAVAFSPAGRAVAAPHRYNTGRDALLRRESAELAACPGEAFGLRVPLTSEQEGNAPAYDVNLFDTCSVYPAVPRQATGFTVEVARLPRHVALAHDVDAVRRPFHVTPFGELVVTAGCPSPDADTKPGSPQPEGRPPVVAAFPLPDPRTTPARFTLTGEVPAPARGRDLCFQFTSPVSDPFYAIGSVQLREDPPR